jgi:membrane protein involved in colicin uptake
VMAVVGKDGSVQKTTVLGGDPDLSTAATDAVQQYKFTPYMRCGQAVEFSQVVVVPFAPAAIPDLGTRSER